MMENAPSSVGGVLGDIDEVELKGERKDAVAAATTAVPMAPTIDPESSHLPT